MSPTDPKDMPRVREKLRSRNDEDRAPTSGPPGEEMYRVAREIERKLERKFERIVAEHVERGVESARVESTPPPPAKKQAGPAGVIAASAALVTAIFTGLAMLMPQFVKVLELRQAQLDSATVDRIVAVEKKLSKIEQFRDAQRRYNVEFRTRIRDAFEQDTGVHWLEHPDAPEPEDPTEFLPKPLTPRGVERARPGKPTQPREPLPIPP